MHPEQIIKHPEKFIKQLIQPLFNTGRTRQIFNVNPTLPNTRKEVEEIKISIFSYYGDELVEEQCNHVKDIQMHYNQNGVSWINVDGIKKEEIEAICQQFKVHPLIVEDILSFGQRPKMDEIDNVLFGLLNMLYFNEKHASVEVEQISIVLGKHFVITFQEDPDRDVFNMLREKLKIKSSKLRLRGADYLCYSLLDMIVDHYFVVMEKLVDRIEAIEEEIIRQANVRSLARINNFRKELIVLRRNVVPVRDLINGFRNTESDLIDGAVEKYFKDIYDHILQANDFVDNYRDMLNNLQELYISKVNLKMNEVMKVIAVVTCILAPATVIGGIFGMNFDVIPFQHSYWAFYSTVVFMLIVVPVFMIWIFKRRGWF